MKFEKINEYIPFIAFSVFLLFAQYHLFVTPKELADTRVAILTEVESRYATKSENSFLKEQVDDMKIKIDKIYDKIIGGQ